MVIQMTDFLIISSTRDRASANIRDKLLISEKYKFRRTEYSWHGNPLYELYEIFSNAEEKNLLGSSGHKVFLGQTNQRLIFLKNVIDSKPKLSLDFLIFASRHRSKSAKPSFLVHTTGNWSGDVRYGGKKKDLSRASALLLKAGYLSLKEHPKTHVTSNYSIDIESTHHGPTDLEIPLLFMELGSSSSEWNSTDAGLLVANSIIKAICRYLQYKESNNQKVAVGFGGTHYSPQFQKIAEENEIAISYICPKYYIKSLDKELINQMLSKNVEKIDYFIIDWKGTNSRQKSYLMDLLECFEIPIKRSKDF
jgi:D-aminoacyl-tRNA deacylase